MNVSNDRNRFLQEMVGRLMNALTEAAVVRFGKKARDLAGTVMPIEAPPAWREHDFVEVLLPLAVPWMRAMAVDFGHDEVSELVAKHLGQVMREYGRQVLARSDGTLADRVERAQAPIPRDALTIDGRWSTGELLGFTVTRCRYAEILGDIGAADLGPVLICDLDFVIAEGMRLRLVRSQTLMTHGRPCDFRYATLPGDSGK